MRDYRTEIDDITYDGIWETQRDHLIRQGLFLDDAIRAAHEAMEATYIRRSWAMQQECQHDYYDERDGDWTR